MTSELLHEMLDVAADRYPDRTAVRRADGVLSYSQAQRWSRELASALVAAGVQRGNRVVLAVPDSVLAPALVYACARAGATFVLVNHAAPRPLFEHILDDAEPTLVISSQPDLVDGADRRGITRRTLQELRIDSETAAPWCDRPLSPDERVALLYTSGSTAMPKAVVSTHQQMTFATSAIHAMLAYRPEDVVYSVLPLSFDYGLYQIFLCTIAGSELALGGSNGGRHGLLVELERSGATVLPAVPSLAMNLCRMLARTERPRLRLRLLTNTGAAMPPAIVHDLRRRIPGLKVQLMYGLTECKRATIAAVDADLTHPGTCGTALPGTEVYVVDEDGAPVPADEVGEVIVRGPNVMDGYWRRPELTAERFHYVGSDRCLRTGDFGWLDAHGHLRLAGRRDDVYKERGFRVSTIEVEAAAHRIDGVDAAAVVPPALDDEGATLVVEASLPPVDVLAALCRELDAEKVPRRCVVVDRLPLTSNGKVERRRLESIVRASAGP